MIRKTLLVISLVLLVGTVGLWVRSYWVQDLFGYNCPTFSVAVSSGYGTIEIDYNHRITFPFDVQAEWWNTGFYH